MDETQKITEHFRGCHPEDAEDQRETPDGWDSGEPQECWHCGTPTPLGCNCADCWQSADDVPPSAVYHCPLCGRWWAYMIPRITKITFGAAE